MEDLPKVPGFSWIIPGELAGMKFPSEPQHYRSLMDVDVGIILCLNEILPSFDLDKCFEGSDGNPRVIHFPINDYGITEQQALKKTLEHVADARAGRAVVMHCMAGLSRTGMILACYLVQCYSMEVKDAIALVNQTRGKGKGRAVMTFKQENFVNDYGQYLTSSKT
eukprot:TRINITY_DN8784_c0_g1_i1.p1 TRINITY_DN8784_c0_g1~~TRINITY_DN8784_c0_g1_i1.p1  ORF type:complete len:187 (+),score=16.96 TRINITY_DN8784_c0_g1_i1:65-562(+)